MRNRGGKLIRRKWRNSVVPPVALCGLLLWGPLWGCNRAGADAESRQREATGAPVTVSEVTTRDVPVQIQVFGNAEAYRTVTMKSQVQGEIKEIRFVEGDNVKAGDLLFMLDRRSFEAALASAQAALVRDVALAKDAEQEAVRLEGLFKQGTIAPRENDKARATADAQWAQVDADRAAVDKAALNLEYCTIHAPIDGCIGSLLVNVGDIVKAPDTDMVVINQVQPIYVTFAVPEHYLTQIRNLQDKEPLVVAAKIPGEEIRELGTLSFIDNQVDRSTGTIRLKGTFSNDKRALWPGQFVNVTLTLCTDTGVTVVSTQAIQNGQSGAFVFVVQADQTVAIRPVTTYREYDGFTIVGSELQPGETVVTDGQLRLRDGVKIKVKSSDKSESAKDGTGS